MPPKEHQPHLFPQPDAVHPTGVARIHDDPELDVEFRNMVARPPRRTFKGVRGSTPVVRGDSEADTGQPLYLEPTSSAELVHSEEERAIGRAAKAAIEATLAEQNAQR